MHLPISPLHLGLELSAPLEQHLDLAREMRDLRLDLPDLRAELRADLDLRLDLRAVLREVLRRARVRGLPPLPLPLRPLPG